MDNNSVISELKACVKKLEDDIKILKKKRDGIPSDTPKQIQQKKELTSLIAEMIAEKNSLETIINEREAAVAGSIPPLSNDLVAKFTTKMNILNQVIKADQGFDQIVAIANGINSASAEISKITAKP
jgi:hypothetical protein